MGWIEPLSKIKHKQASRHGGRVYLKASDILQDADQQMRVKEGAIVDFYVYVDPDGLGAEECRLRSVLRLTVTHAQAKAALKDSPQWSQYLTDSEYYLSFERDHGVLVRKYMWQMPFALLELWGHPNELATAAISIGAKGENDHYHIRVLLPETDTEKADSLQIKHQLSTRPVISSPLPCRSLTFDTTMEECQEAMKAFLNLMTTS